MARIVFSLVLAIMWSLFLAPRTSAQSLSLHPNILRVTSTADTLVTDGAYIGEVQVDVDGIGAPKAAYKIVGVKPANSGDPDIDWFIVSPSSGVTTGFAIFLLNPEVLPYMNSGIYQRVAQFAPVDQPSAIREVAVTLVLGGSGSPLIKSVLGSATLQPLLAPGQAATIFGTHLSTPPLIGKFNNLGLYPTVLGNTMVTFNGIAAPLLYVSTSQINCMVPYGVSGSKSVDVSVIRVYPSGVNTHSPVVTMPLQDTAPGLFTLDQSGSGPALAFTNYLRDASSINTASNPAPRGSSISLLATGSGNWNLNLYADGAIVFYREQPTGRLPIVVAPKAPVSVTIGGQPANLRFVGAALDQVTGMLEVDVDVPAGIEPGAQPIVLKIGDNDNSAQKTTVWVQ